MAQLPSNATKIETYKGQLFGLPGAVMLFINTLAIVLVSSQSLIMILVCVIWLNLILLFSSKGLANFFVVEQDSIMIGNQWLVFIESKVEINKLSRAFRQDGVLSSYLVLVPRSGKYIRVDMGGLSENQKVEMLNSLNQKIKSHSGASTSHLL